MRYNSKTIISVNGLCVMRRSSSALTSAAEPSSSCRCSVRRRRLPTALTCPVGLINRKFFSA